jgi:hypothetical protein
MAAETDTVEAPEGVLPVEPGVGLPEEPPVDTASTAKSIKATRTKKRVFFIIL